MNMCSKPEEVMKLPSHHFIKVFLPDLTSQHLKIPPAFRVHLRNKSLRMVSLRGPSGNVWDVELVDSSNGLRFESGWKEFVTDHAIETGDILVFRFDGCSCFSVLVFDATACEKEVAFLARPHAQNVADVNEPRPAEEMAIVPRTSQQEVDIICVKEEEGEATALNTQIFSQNNGPGIDKKRKMRSINCLQEPKSKEIFYSGNLASRRSMKSPDAETIAKTIISSQYSTSKSSIEECLQLRKPNKVRRRGELVAKVQKMPPLSSQRRPVTKEEVDKALCKAKSFMSKNPFFLIVMQDSYVYSSFFMNVPGSFAQPHLPRISQVLTLWDENDERWAVTYVYYGNRGALSGGWGAFAKAHNLEKFDVCIFELIKKQHLKVHIFRVVDEITSLLPNSNGKS
ncbi:B3 domain-containing protein Os11g0197600-like [Zingiber officinale]|uniref:B3 domain-containing protein Os11g0197600-like n=1 Tax=Zingiber officinale TaxID=94328 RepID=UPI001C4CC369|nr:B3 domain-containing protein Os11g0197600-like [Zingiber officinale]XP_042384049.1 B3 domain-containing protein Os11g0197600-like [Zingiber officinale]XP_042384050.1 B3 domain-containing protein Os11g0197600-like [Zingiber officinale]XP_042384051.1 B3 domain-containing protein Os11g0197600-like [Zingiber officinale]XP_042384052.1 B3 domain-containing protein Os11g0197600-like [Zingiber officinale]XP_042384053.1 B3 domain-containing protein Os11g0197600-like [Zingiber officinale]XP_04238405